MARMNCIALKARFTGRSRIYPDREVGESMWFLVTGARAGKNRTGKLCGTLDNEPFDIKGLKYGAKVCVLAQDILDATPVPCPPPKSKRPPPKSKRRRKAKK
jgi:hypothetical protein